MNECNENLFLMHICIIQRYLVRVVTSGWRCPVLLDWLLFRINGRIVPRIWDNPLCIVVTLKYRNRPTIKRPPQITFHFKNLHPLWVEDFWPDVSLWSGCNFGWRRLFGDNRRLPAPGPFTVSRPRLRESEGFFFDLGSSFGARLECKELILCRWRPFLTWQTWTDSRA